MTAPAARPRTARARGRRRPGARTLLACLAVLLVVVPFLLVLVLVQDRWSPLVRLDDGVRDGLHRLVVSHRGLVRPLQVVSALGTSGAYLLLFGALAVGLLRRGRRRLAVFTVVTVAGGSLLNTAVKSVVDRARPVLPDPVAHASYSSFPSGHAQGVVVATGVLLLVLLPAVPRARRPVAGGLAVLWALLMGFSRVALGVHYLSDVVAGYVLGAAWLAACTAAFSAWRQDAGGPPVDPTEGLEPSGPPDVCGDGVAGR